LKLLDHSDIKISPMVILEMQFLREAGKIELKVDTFLRDMQEELGMGLCTIDFSTIIWESVKISWTRDPFDRLVVAQAAVNGAPLVTKDRLILQHYRRAIWS
ncbi:MAG: hypothetical protein HQL19_08640, partial [Candidatus Omnitrophica bacterium]|nr:hypothetical protein [Candidatus Omnitrophota bacterium]